MATSRVACLLLAAPLWGGSHGGSAAQTGQIVIRNEGKIIPAHAVPGVWACRA